MLAQYVVRAAGVASLLLSANAGPAQETIQAEAKATSGAAASEEADCCVIPAGSPVEIEIVDALNSPRAQSRDSFTFRLAEPLVVDGRIVLPAGTPGVGEVVHSARARAGGKAGELILAARYLDHQGVRIPLRTMRYGRSQGADNSGAVAVGNVVSAVVFPVASVAAFLVSGGEVDIPAGTRANALTASEMMLAPAEPISLEEGD